MCSITTDFAGNLSLYHQQAWRAPVHIHADGSLAESITSFLAQVLACYAAYSMQDCRSGPAPAAAGMAACLDLVELNHASLRMQRRHLHELDVQVLVNIKRSPVVTAAGAAPQRHPASAEDLVS